MSKYTIIETIGDADKHSRYNGIFDYNSHMSLYNQTSDFAKQITHIKTQEDYEKFISRPSAFSRVNFLIYKDDENIARCMLIPFKEATNLNIQDLIKEEDLSFYDNFSTKIEDFLHKYAYSDYYDTLHTFVIASLLILTGEKQEYLHAQLKEMGVALNHDFALSADTQIFMYEPEAYYGEELVHDIRDFFDAGNWKEKIDKLIVNKYEFLPNNN